MEKWRKKSGGRVTGTRTMYFHSGARGGNITAQPEPRDDLTASANKPALPKKRAVTSTMGQESLTPDRSA